MYEITKKDLVLWDLIRSDIDSKNKLFLVMQLT